MTRNPSFFFGSTNIAYYESLSTSPGARHMYVTQASKKGTGPRRTGSVGGSSSAQLQFVVCKLLRRQSPAAAESAWQVSHSEDANSAQS